MMLDAFQRHLDDVSEALMTGNFDAYHALVCDPLVVTNEKSTTVITGIDQFRFGFDSYVGMLKSQHASHLMRLASAVTELGPTLLMGHYITQILRDGHRIYGPFESALVLRLVDGVWKLAVVASSSHREDYPINVLPSAGGRAPSPKTEDKT